MFITFLLKYQMHSSPGISGRKTEVKRKFYLTLRQLLSVTWQPSSSPSSRTILTSWFCMRAVMKCSGPATAISSWVRGSPRKVTRLQPAARRASTILTSALSDLGLTTNTELGSTGSTGSTDWSCLESSLPVRGRHRQTERRRRSRRTGRPSNSCGDRPADSFRLHWKF